MSRVDHFTSDSGGDNRWLPSGSFKQTICGSRSEEQFGAITSSKRGFLHHQDEYYVEVSRKSVHSCVGGNSVEGRCIGGFGRECDQTGFYHFVASSPTSASGIFLQLATPIMDYTCPKWVVNAKEGYYEERLAPTHRQWRWNSTPDNVFNRPLPIKCLRGWCTPAAACVQATNGAFDAWAHIGERINEPAFWKSDPPSYEHSLKARGFRTAIVFWAGHDRALLARCVQEQSCEGSAKVLVDYRSYGVSDVSYRNGSHMIACPPGHFYHVASWAARQNAYEMRPCRCVENRLKLNCEQLGGDCAQSNG